MQKEKRDKRPSCHTSRHPISMCLLRKKWNREHIVLSTSSIRYFSFSHGEWTIHKVTDFPMLSFCDAFIFEIQVNNYRVNGCYKISFAYSKKTETNYINKITKKIFVKSFQEPLSYLQITWPNPSSVM